MQVTDDKGVNAKKNSWSLSRPEWLQEIKEVIALESAALQQTARAVDASFSVALDMLFECTGKVVVTGAGKSGIIARKIAATLSSTGTSAAFLHPSDAMHGDLGMLGADDVVLILSKSGESPELAAILPAIRKIGPKTIAITSTLKSSLAAEATVVLHAPIQREACPHDLAPTVSSTVFLAIGDALAITLMKRNGFQPDDFAKYHPGGSLGRRLLLKVRDLMIPVEKVPILDPRSCQFADLISSLSQSGLGIVLFSTSGNRLEGILTDGDIRRLLDKHASSVFDLKVEGIINRSPQTLSPETKAVDALHFMESHTPPLNVVPIVEADRICGVARLHEFLNLS